MSFLACAAVTLHAVVKVANTLFEMFRADCFLPMRMASKAGIAVVVEIDVARLAGHVMMAIQDEKRVVLECRGLPPLLTVALRAIDADVLMEIVIGCSVARATAISRCGSQQFVRERFLTTSIELQSLMFVMTLGATGFDQILVERRLHSRFSQCCTLGRAQSDVRHRVARDTAF